MPKFEKGGVMGYDGKYLMNEKRQEYVQRGREIFAPQGKNVVIEGQKGDIIHKDFSDLLNTINISPIKLNKIEDKSMIDVILNGIEGSIEKGFNKAKINNYINQPNLNLDDEIWRANQSNW